jgi:glycerol-3-phosphate dehydrogenase
VLDHPGLRAAIGEDEFFFENKDGRIVLIFPLFDKVLVGTSDIPIEDPNQARCTDQEVDYFFEMIGHVFPEINLERDQIVFRFSGVRPLEYSQAKTTGQITRDHTIKEDRFGDIPVYSLVGGKWTSYRAFSELTTDRALAFLGKSRIGETRNLAIGGGLDYAAVKATWQGSTQLFERYGSRAREVSQYQEGIEKPLAAYPDMTRGEIAYLCEKEHVVHLDDLILRRTLMAFLGHLNLGLVDELAGILAEYLNWSAEEKAAEVERTLAILHDQHGISTL